MKRLEFAAILVVLGVAFLVAQPPTINPAIQIRGPIPSLAIACTDNACAIGPGIAESVSGGPFTFTGGSVFWIGATGTGAHSGEIYFTPGVSSFGASAIANCFISGSIVPSDITTNLAGSTCATYISSTAPPHGTYYAWVTVANGIIQPVSIPQYIPVPMP